MLSLGEPGKYTLKNRNREETKYQQVSANQG